MSDIRFLPNPEDTENTHISLRSGHACRVHAVSPLDGEPGTVIPARFHEAAIAAGCKLVGLGGHQEQAPQDSNKAALLAKAIEAIVARGNAEEVENSGKPTLKAVKVEAGYTVSRTELDAAWDKFTDSLADEELSA